MQLNTPLWRQTPLVVFPVCLGFMSLSLGWANAARVIPGLSEGAGYLLLTASTGYFFWFMSLYLRKIIARPSVVWDDMQTAPARAGGAAMAMTMLLLAAALLPFGGLAPLVWWLGVVMQVVASGAVLWALLQEPRNKRHFATFQYLTFVGPVLGLMAGVPLGYIWESKLLVSTALVTWVVITTGTLVSLRRAPLPPGLRPSVMIFLAPVCLLALGYGMLGYDIAFAVFYRLCCAIAAGLVLLVPWMVKGGYTPAWGAFTFPLAAFLNVQVMAMSKGYGVWAEAGVYAGLAIATPVVLYMAYRTVMEWGTGNLARKSKAAIA